jgi:hypothetical protein
MKMNEKYILSLSLELVKVGSYDPLPEGWPPEQPPLFKWPLVDTKFDMPALK